MTVTGHPYREWGRRVGKGSVCGEETTVGELVVSRDVPGTDGRQS